METESSTGPALIAPLSRRRRLVDLALWPMRLTRGILVSGFRVVSGYALGGVATMLVAALLLSLALPNQGLWAALGQWSLVAIYAVLGLIGGVLLGVNAAAARAVGLFELEVRRGLASVTPEQAERLVPRRPVDQLRATYDRTLDDMISGTLGRLRIPGPVRRLLRSRLRQAVIEDFLTECETRGRATAGFGELRDWLVGKGMPLVTAPAQGQLRLWRYLVLGGFALILGATVVLALPATWPAVGRALPAVLFGLGALVLAWGLPRARRHASPWRWRLGVLVIGAGLAAWPTIYIRLAGLDLGMVWLVVVAATIASFAFGVRQAFIEADRPRF